MSNALAISTVTAAFSRRVLAAANAAVPAAIIRLGSPTAQLSTDGAPVVNIHLYRVEPNPAHSNSHLPSRASDGTRRRRSQLAMDLHYMLSFYGDHDLFEPDRMVGEVMISLEDQPALAKGTIENAIAANDELEDSDLADAMARLRVTRHLMSLDEFSKIWSIFYQVPHTISLAYEISHVVIESQEAEPLPLPIAQPRLWVAPMQTLRLDHATGPGGRPAIWGDALEITGRGMAAEGLTLELGDHLLDLQDIPRSSDKITLALEAASFGGIDLTVGLHSVRILAPPASAGQGDHLRARSNTIAMILHPQITGLAVAAPGGGAVASGTLTVDTSPAVAETQEVRVHLNARDPANPLHVTLEGRAVPDPLPGNPPANQLEFAFENLPRGDYLVRLDVDGHISPVEIDEALASPTYGQIIGPEVTI